MDIVRMELMAEYETAERAGAASLFQVTNIIGYSENDEQVNLTKFIDQGYFYEDENEVLKDIVEKCSEYSFDDCDIEIVA